MAISLNALILLSFGIYCVAVHLHHKVYNFENDIYVGKFVYMQLAKLLALKNSLYLVYLWEFNISLTYLYISGLLANDPLCREIEHIPDTVNVGGIANTFDFCCVKVVCATFTNNEENESHQAENDKTVVLSNSQADSSSILDNNH